MRHAKLATLLIAGCATMTRAQPPSSPALPPRPDCGAGEYRQLDFWIGHWRVVNTADGIEYATSAIESVLGGCAIKETYDAPNAPGGAYLGTSYSAFDGKDRRWHQMYIDNGGTVSWYSGARSADGMVFQASGKQALQRMTYRLQADGSVRQVGQTSIDDGETWQAGYDYTYRKRDHR